MSRSQPQNAVLNEDYQLCVGCRKIFTKFTYPDHNGDPLCDECASTFREGKMSRSYSTNVNVVSGQRTLSDSVGCVA